jgi:hypothetical protein
VCDLTATQRQTITGTGQATKSNPGTVKKVAKACMASGALPCCADASLVGLWPGVEKGKRTHMCARLLRLSLLLSCESVNASLFLSSRHCSCVNMFSSLTKATACNWTKGGFSGPDISLGHRSCVNGDLSARDKEIFADGSAHVNGATIVL